MLRVDARNEHMNVIPGHVLQVLAAECLLAGPACTGLLDCLSCYRRGRQRDSVTPGEGDQARQYERERERPIGMERLNERMREGATETGREGEREIGRAHV